MASRPAVLDSRLLRILCPLRLRSKQFATATCHSIGNQQWGHPPASSSIDNDQVARLAARPLHPLTLADLVR